MSRFKTLPLSWLCDLLYLLSSPLLVPAWLFLSRLMTREKYRRGFFRKLGSVERREGASRSLWVHAVSVGEVLTAAPLIEALERGLEGWDVSLESAPLRPACAEGSRRAPAAPGRDRACRARPRRRRGVRDEPD